jgi:hypothetical protein
MKIMMVIFCCLFIAALNCGEKTDQASGRGGEMIKKDGSKGSASEEEDRAVLSALNAQFIQNYMTNDTASHNKIIHRDFVCIEGSGTIVGREEYLREWAHGYDPKVFISFTYEDEFIRIFGNIALVRSKNVYARKIDGKIVNGSTIYTDTYVKENGKWSCVQAQITGIKQPAK